MKSKPLAITPIVLKLLFKAALCAHVSMPIASPDTIHKSVPLNSAIIFERTIFALSLAFLEPTTATVLSKLHLFKSPL